MESALRGLGKKALKILSWKSVWGDMTGERGKEMRGEGKGEEGDRPTGKG